MRLPPTIVEVWGESPDIALQTILATQPVIRDVVAECGIPASTSPDRPYATRVLTEFGRLSGRQVPDGSLAPARMAIVAGKQNRVDISWIPLTHAPSARRNRGGHLTIHVNM